LHVNRLNLRHGRHVKPSQGCVGQGTTVVIGIPTVISAQGIQAAQTGYGQQRINLVEYLLVATHASVIITHSGFDKRMSGQGQHIE